MDNMSELNITLGQIDDYIKVQEKAIKRGKALERLKKNPDFVEVIMEGYIEVEARKLFKILTDPTGASEYTNEQIVRKLDSISDFKVYVGTSDYTGTIEIEALNAPGLIAREEDERVNVTAEAAMEINQ